MLVRYGVCILLCVLFVLCWQDVLFLPFEKKHHVGVSSKKYIPTRTQAWHAHVPLTNVWKRMIVAQLEYVPHEYDHTAGAIIVFCRCTWQQRTNANCRDRPFILCTPERHHAQWEHTRTHILETACLQIKRYCTMYNSWPWCIRKSMAWKKKWTATICFVLCRWTCNRILNIQQAIVGWTKNNLATIRHLLSENIWSSFWYCSNVGQMLCESKRIHKTIEYRLASVLKLRLHTICSFH